MVECDMQMDGRVSDTWTHSRSLAPLQVLQTHETKHIHALARAEAAGELPSLACIGEVRSAHRQGAEAWVHRTVFGARLRRGGCWSWMGIGGLER